MTWQSRRARAKRTTMSAAFWSTRLVRSSPRRSIWAYSKLFRIFFILFQKKKLAFLQTNKNTQAYFSLNYLCTFTRIGKMRRVVHWDAWPTARLADSEDCRGNSCPHCLSNQSKIIQLLIIKQPFFIYIINIYYQKETFIFNGSFIFYFWLLGKNFLRVSIDLWRCNSNCCCCCYFS